MIMDIREQLGNIRNDSQLVLSSAQTFTMNERHKSFLSNQLTNLVERLDHVLNQMDKEDERLREVVGNKELSEHELAMIALMVKDMIR